MNICMGGGADKSKIPNNTESEKADRHLPVLISCFVMELFLLYPTTT